ncbi:MAG: tetratricopeptide repeat protein [Paraglaciecola sp.]|nr:tetratricopeptide repeat protein [Paraglaciecola sp.]NCT47116.1 tetratricopeptide repeat protein [Paraglaciecola sp.]
MSKVLFLIVFFAWCWLSVATSQALAQNKDLSDIAADAYTAGQWQQAAQAYEQVLKQQPDNQGAWFRLGRVYIELKQANLAQHALNKALVAGSVPLQFVQVQLARAAMLQNQSEQAITWLNQAASLGFSNATSISQEPLFAGLMQHPDYAVVARKIEENASPCMFQAPYREFDFWLGHWSVYGNPEKTGPLYGHNQIKREQQGCLVMEYWQSASGGPGTSMNYYDGTKQKWVQHWVSAGGTVINMEGGLVAGTMVMQGQIFYINTSINPVRDFRASFSRLDHGVVRQYFEESIDAGQSWYPWFEGFYFPEPAPQ